MKAWVLTMEWSTGVNDVTLNVEAVRGLSGVSGVYYQGYPGRLGHWNLSRSGKGTCRERQEDRLLKPER